MRRLAIPAAALIVSLYVLAIGPTYWVAKKTGWHSLYAIHRPIASLADSWLGSANLKESYLEVWHAGELEESFDTEMLQSK